MEDEIDGYLLTEDIILNFLKNDCNISGTNEDFNVKVSRDFLLQTWSADEVITVRKRYILLQGAAAPLTGSRSTGSQNPPTNELQGSKERTFKEKAEGNAIVTKERKATWRTGVRKWLGIYDRSTPGLRTLGQ